ncbi:MAG: hypothetical protein M3Y57_15715 [Acidobacteriota bacterium]|nr:hypothetical protein [Acidobacteriota bacterium]
MLAAIFIAMLQAQSALFGQIADSGRCVTLAESPDSRVNPPPAIAPGPPPVLSFRYYEGKMHHRFGDVDLMLDDAGH